MSKQLTGVITAIVTPFKGGSIDYSSLKRLLRFQLDGGIDGLVVSGTTGESPTLTIEEKDKILSFVISEVSGQVPVIMGTGTNNTAESVQATKRAKDLNADGALVVVPYYNKPPQAGLIAHFQSVADATNLPIILYNVPSRTITSLSVESVARLSEYKNIVGIKEATGDINLTKEILKASKSGFFVLSGDDGTYLDLYEVGAKGVISVLSNIMPKQTKNFNKNQFADIKDLVDALFCEANPIPVKMALHWMGLIDSAELRLPLLKLSNNNQEKLKALMKKAGLI